jgi:hypothetical protein
LLALNGRLTYDPRAVLSLLAVLGTYPRRPTGRALTLVAACVFDRPRYPFAEATGPGFAGAAGRSGRSVSINRANVFQGLPVTRE